MFSQIIELPGNVGLYVGGRDQREDFGRVQSFQELDTFYIELFGIFEHWAVLEFDLFGVLFVSLL
jgi:hypothetical protein